jgi:hypothetical protein
VLDVTTAPQLGYCAHPTPEGIVEALRTDGCALIRGAIPAGDAAQLAVKLASYEPGGAVANEDLMRDDPMLASLARPGQLGADLIDWGKTGSAELLGTLFQRDPAWLQLVDPSPVVDAMELALGDSCHLVTQKGWRNHPGHDAGGVFHTDEIFVEMPEEIASDPRYEPPINIVTALFYLVDVDVALCPTWVIPKSFRSGRSPMPGETSWRDNKPAVVCAKQGDCLLFRSDVWHGGGLNSTPDRHRFVCETVYGARKISQKFVSHPDNQLSPSMVELIHQSSASDLPSAVTSFKAMLLNFLVPGSIACCSGRTPAFAWRRLRCQLLPRDNGGSSENTRSATMDEKAAELLVSWRILVCGKSHNNVHPSFSGSL